MSLTIAQVVRSIQDQPQQPLWQWRVQLSGLSEIPSVSFGTFNSGDSYMVLYTYKSPEGGVKRKIYMWQGSASSQDEVAASAIFAKELDDALGGSPQQVHIVQNEEPDEFKQLFPNGLNFRHGGVASSLRQASTQGKAPAKLFIVKSPGPGKAAQVTEVRLSASSLVSNASFVLDDDLSNTLYVWHGGAAGLREKTKSLDTANTFRSNRGQLRLAVLDQDDVSSGDALAFFALLSANDPVAAVAAITTCEGAVPKGAELSGGANGTGASDAKLFRVVNGRVDGTAISPPTRTALDPALQLLLVAGGRAWLWVGSKAGAPQTQVALSHARGQGVSGEVELVKDRLEPGLFMTHFPDWSKAEFEAYKAYQAAHAPVAGFASSGLPTSPGGPPIDFAALAAKMVEDGNAAASSGQAGAKQGTVVVPPGSKITVSVVVGHELIEVSGAELGNFFAGEAYMVLHEWVTNTGEPRQVIYFWQGRHATNIEQGTAALLATDLHNTKFKGTSALVRVAQQAEPPHLVSLFNGRMVVHRGERPASGLPNGGAGVQGPRLYQIKSDGTQAAHAVEIELSAASLNSGDSFLVKSSNGSVTLWQGSGSTADEVQLAAAAAVQLGAAPSTVKEGSESAGFWDQLGGRKDYPKTLTRPGIRPPVLYRLRDAGRAGMRVEASVSFSQEDLDSLDLSILEDGDTLIVWNGREAAPTERLHAHQVVEAYVKALGRKVNIVDVEDGAEPPFFTQHFAGWDSTKRTTIVNQFAKLKPVSATSP